MTLPLIWSAVLLGFLASRLAETRLHRRNYAALARAGADERVPRLMRLYYGLHWLLLPLAAAEQLLTSASVGRGLLVGGLTAVLLAQALRFWAIQALGPLWTMRCLGLPGLRHRQAGPYRWLENPEYLSRLVEGAGLCCVFGAHLTLALFVAASLVLSRRLAAAERLQASEMEEEAREGRRRVYAS